MRAAKEGEGLVVEALKTEREPVDPCRTERAEFFALEGSRIGFERDFGLWVDAPQRSDPITTPTQKPAPTAPI